MWLKNFQFNSKVLSEIELLTLVNIPDDEFVDATALIEQLDEHVPHWNAERGTIYPLLHRLTDLDLLEKNKGGRSLQFRRTAIAKTFLSGLITSDGLFAQFDTSSRYLELLALSTIGIDPFAAKEFLAKLGKRVSAMLANVDRFRDQAERQIEEDDWVEIDIE